MTATATRTRRANSYAGTCTHCGGHVAAQGGLLGGKVDGRWTVEHSTCPTQTLAPVASRWIDGPQATAAPRTSPARCENCDERTARYSATDSSGIRGRVCGRCYGDREALSFA